MHYLGHTYDGTSNSDATSSASNGAESGIDVGNGIATTGAPDVGRRVRRVGRGRAWRNRS